MINKEQPQNIEVEKKVLGSIILFQESYDLVSALLKPEHFYNEQNVLI